jgi:VanZ family protein
VAISDKVVHAVEFGGLALCLCRALRAQLPTCSSPVVALISVLLTLGYGGVDELHQLFVPGRSTDFADILADGLGAILAAWGWIKGSHYWPWLH